MESRGIISRREFLKSAGGYTLYELSKRLGAIADYQETSEEERIFIAGHEVTGSDTSRNVVCMTYDDFNSLNNIDIILDEYKARGVKTTFFFPGGYSRPFITLPRYSKQIERIVDEGHVLGCHGLLHDPLTTYKSDQLRKDVEQWIGIVHDIVPGYRVKWMRYPFGDRNQRTREVFAEYGMQSVMWSLESGGEDVETVNRVTEKVGAGEIVLSHTQRYYDARQAGQILDYLISSGYKVESVATGLNPGDYFTKKSKGKQNNTPR